jgi:hypothetical protein
MESLGYDARLKDAIGPDVSVCMSEPGKRELCTDLKEIGQPWVIYSPSNIANIQAERYRDMYGADETPSRTPTPTRTSTVPASFSFVNNTTGNRSLLRVGDRWTLSVTGPPNTDVVIVGGSGGRADRTVMGRTNAAGVWSTSGSPGPAEIGNWVQQISVGAASAGTLSFQVVATTSSQTSGTNGGERTPDKSTSEKLADEAQKSGIPTDWTNWAKENTLLLVGGAAAVFFLMRGSK